jgi:hypothetical protein
MVWRRDRWNTKMEREGSIQPRMRNSRSRGGRFLFGIFVDNHMAKFPRLPLVRPFSRQCPKHTPAPASSSETDTLFPISARRSEMCRACPQNRPERRQSIANLVLLLLPVASVVVLEPPQRHSRRRPLPRRQHRVFVIHAIIFFLHNVMYSVVETTKNVPCIQPQ